MVLGNHCFSVLMLVTKFAHIDGAEKNQSLPFFDKIQYETEVDENEDIGHIIFNITAKNHNQVAPFRYEITGGNIGDVFGVHNTSGAIFVAGKLDYELITKFDLKLEASNSHSKNYTSLIVHIRDANDNPPVFGRQTYKMQINEEESVNLPNRILKVTATDADYARPANIIYFLSGQGIDPDNPKNSKFEVDRHTGEIFVLSPLDRDHPEGRPLWRFTVFAQDEGGEGLVGYADVQVILKDINDNPPIFPREVYYGNVTENGTAGVYVMTVTAIDYDDPSDDTNAKILYSIEKNVIVEETGYPIFEIDPQFGTIITTVCCLDREKTSDYSIQLVATDGGGLKSTSTVSIKVIDINDMPPSFLKFEWFVEVNETGVSILRQIPILTVSVQDEDETNNFQYKIVESSGYGASKFKIVRNSDGSGTLTISKPLDYEDVLQSNGFRFKIQVTDSEDFTDTYHTADSWVIVKLKDINDNNPVFEQSHINVLVPENFEIGRVLTTFRAVDPDQHGNSRVTYIVDRSSNKDYIFLINQHGTVRIQRPLDRETSQHHQVTILAIDDGVPSRTSIATLNVIVQDINDNAPIFIKEYRPVILENFAAQVIVEIYAIDIDDYSAGNGAPFKFLMDPNASAIIRNSFNVIYNPYGNGSAIIKSRTRFDREQQKEYKIPIIINDSGIPIMTSTSTLTVTIGDVNDNNMTEAVKNIVVYKYPGQEAEREIGRVYIYDLDDWDLPDKKFYWENEENPGFKLNEKSGMITMKHNTAKGFYTLNFKVFDKKYNETVSATVIVIIRELDRKTLLNSASVRLNGVTDEDFIRVWDNRQGNLPNSKQEIFRKKTAEILNVNEKNIEIFSVQLKSKYPPVTDVRFSTHIRSEYMQPVQINGLVLIHKEIIENSIGADIFMVEIGDINNCNEVFNNNFNSSALSYLVDANKTALVSPRLEVFPSCSCKSKSLVNNKQCKNYLCYNGGTCIESKYVVTCKCLQGFIGPRCQKTLISFKGDGWTWYPALKICEDNHLNIHFITKEPDGLLLYTGPLIAKRSHEMFLSDFISLELKDGFPKLLINYGSEAIELYVKTKEALNDGKWHRLDIFWNRETTRIVVDFCQSADIVEQNDDVTAEFNDSSCQDQRIVPPFDNFLNISAPLQLGGIWPQTFSLVDYGLDTKKGFNGCIKNIFFNSELIDLGPPAMSKNVFDLCYLTEDNCKQVESTFGCVHGLCLGDLYEAKCHCNPSWSGLNCSIPTVPVTFQPNAYVKYALSFELDPFITQIQLRFRTRKKHCELFRLSDRQNREYVVLEINNSRLSFRYNLNSVRTEELKLMLSNVFVDDGEWHFATVHRYGSVAIIKLDKGESERYNESFEFFGHQFLLLDKQDGVYAGEKPEIFKTKISEINVEFQSGCLDDIRLNGNYLPLPPALNGTEGGQATVARNLEQNCLSSNPCGAIVCPDPLKCVDIWNDYECRCSKGYILLPDSKLCIDKNECLDSPCLNEGICINLGPDRLYRCKCRKGFWGKNCELEEEQRLIVSIGAWSAIALCLFFIFALALMIVYYRQTKVVKQKAPSPHTNISGIVTNCNDNECGENVITGLDITPLQIPLNQLQAESNMNTFEMGVLRTKEPTVNTVTFLEDHIDRSDIYFDVLPSHLRRYCSGKSETVTRSFQPRHSNTMQD